MGMTQFAHMDPSPQSYQLQLQMMNLLNIQKQAACFMPPLPFPFPSPLPLVAAQQTPLPSLPQAFDFGFDAAVLKKLSGTCNQTVGPTMLAPSQLGAPVPLASNVQNAHMSLPAVAPSIASGLPAT
eukprot:NODE_5645_length_561_cov_58.832031_g4910_i0.p1 GENE.NODE_5645_length_561_cov_58.832031_g4910_i0~~NODE_5645_length_561_cov_58.832031_g4910_i0.p1  ORF type:complete len:134 (-),score=33.25 NODE_5645_length_561_cov_58.832031_g4910_i0:160-537(-)